MGKKKPRYWPELDDAYAFRVIDSHTHLPLTKREIPRDGAGVALPRAQQLARAKAAGVDAIISSACDVEDIRLAAEQFASFRPDAAPVDAAYAAAADTATSSVDAALTVTRATAAYTAAARTSSVDAADIGTEATITSDEASTDAGADASTDAALATVLLPDVYFALGIHPNEAAVHAGYRDKSPDGLTPHVKDFHELSLDDAIGLVAETARANPQIVVAIGETGLDYFRTGEAGREDQRRAFAAHIALAKELDLPMQIHDRDAHVDVVDVLLTEGAPERTVFHCFSGDAELARVCNEHGWYMSFAGPVTYPANGDLRAAVAAADETLLIVETDAPYLTPAPYRGHPNASYLVGLTLEKLAEVRGTPTTELAERIYATTRELYGLT